MLDQLQSNEETVLEAWKLLSERDDVEEEKIKEFCVQVFSSAKSKKNTLF